jgi:hypothetical protein
MKKDCGCGGGIICWAKVESRVGGRFEWHLEFWMKDGEEPEPGARKGTRDAN